MRLPRNRWFEAVGGKTILKFGKHKGDFLEDLVSTEQGRWYLNMMLREFEDLPSDIRTFIQTALDEGEDPISAEQAKEAESSPSLMVQKMSSLKAKAKAKLKQGTAEKEHKKTAEVFQKRKEEAEW